MSTTAEIEMRQSFAVEDRLLSVDEVAGILHVSDRSVWRLVANGDLPKPARVGRCARWFKSEVQAYLDKLKQQRDGAAFQPTERYSP